MSEGVSEALQAELKNKRICRFCLTQNEPLSNIYSRENRLKNSAPLPLQVMSCVSIEVFTNDGMPNTICDLCRILMEHCYKFKQMCKKADTALRQYPLTNRWPKQLEIPKIPSEVISETDKSPPTSSSNSPVVDKKPVAHQQEKFQTSPVQQPSKPVKKAATPGRPKLLNKSFNRILNKNAQDAPEPILSLPVVKMYESGNVEIVTEIIDQSEVKKYEEPDPIKNAAPVETNVFPCPNCERSFPLRQLLDIHMVNHTRERSFQCNVCDRRFFSKYDLGKHSLIHTGEKPYQCVVCEKAFTRSTLLYRHEKIHTDQPKFLCVYCEKPFLSKDELGKHTERHKKNRPFSCKICGKSFAFKQGLERHEIVHAKDQPYPCQYCDKSFPTPSKLSRHLTAHAGDRPFPCRLCPNSYLLSHHLTRHMRSHTQGSGSYKCYDCEKTFKTRDDLIYHSAVHATQTLVCPLCKEQFESLDRVTEHIKLHAEGEQYACEFCDLIFMTAEKLQSHSDVEHAEDLAAYEQDTKNKIANVKKEMHNKYDEESQDGQQEEGEVIEEFIIEEYHQDDEEHNIGEAESTLIKEENILIAKDISLTPVQKVAPKILNSQQKIKIVSPKGNTIQEIHLTEDESRGEEEYVEDMEIETLERDDDTNEFVKEAEKIEEPPTKTIKLDQRSSPRIADQRVAKEAPKTSPVTRKTPKSVVKTEGQRTKPSISSVLQQIPKSVTVIKKEKGTENTPTTTAQQPQKEVRILNSDRPTKKSSQQASHKTPVKVSPEKTKHDSKPTKQSTETSKKAVNNSSDSIGSQSSTKTEKKTSTAGKSSVPQAIPGSKKLVEMMIGDKKVKVQKIMMTKAAVAAMAKEGKIEMKGGTMILKQDNKTLSGKVVKKTAGADTKK